MGAGTAVAASPGEQKAKTEREYGLDWLRVIAFAILIFYHCGMMFVSWDFHLKNKEQSRTLELVMLFFNRWRLPLLFFISGAGVWFSLRRRSLPQFAGERTMRLLVPLLFGIFVFVPPQIYVERVEKGAHFASYFDFWQTVLQFRPYPQGNFSWHHLWFVAYVFVYALLGIPLFAALRAQAGRRAVGALAGWVERWRPAVYLLNVPNIVAAVTLGPRWPVTHNLTADWANFTGSLLTFLWGFVIVSDRRLLDAITDRRREFLTMWLALMAVFYVVVAGGFRRSLPPLSWDLVNAYIAQMAIFTLIGYARTLLNRSSPFLRYATEAVYPFYILHQTVILVTGWWIIHWESPVAVKFAAAVAGCFSITLLLHEGIRRVPLLRPLFGLRPASTMQR
jgi:hypothetical protein